MGQKPTKEDSQRGDLAVAPDDNQANESSKPAPTAPTSKMDGNDQVTVDPPPKKPLVAVKKPDPPVVPLLVPPGVVPLSVLPPVQHTEPASIYAPFCKSPAETPEAARQRLTKALEQTMSLRKAFTTRVFEKYRIRLQPPVSERTSYQKMVQQMQQMATEKEAEKQHAIRLNFLVTQRDKQQLSDAALAAAALWDNGSVDHADQVMYFSAGLNLIIDMEETRPKYISLAAATAGSIMMDRKEKAIALRHERKNMPKMAPVAAAKTAAKPVTVTTRVPAPKGRKTTPGVSATVLLSIHPTADEVSEGKPWHPATKCLMAHSGKQSTASRWRHPHPESLGGRRRASMPLKQPEPPFLQSYLTLPPLPSAQDARTRAPVEVMEAKEAASSAAHTSVHNILDHFSEKQELKAVTKINLLHSLKSDAQKQQKKQETLDPILTFSVMSAVGLVGRAPPLGTKPKPFGLPSVQKENAALWSLKLQAIHQKVSSSNEYFSKSIFQGKRQCPSSSEDSSMKRQKTEPVGNNPESDPKEEAAKPSDTKVPVESLRGGGDVPSNGTKDRTKKQKPKATHAQPGRPLNVSGFPGGPPSAADLLGLRPGYDISSLMPGIPTAPPINPMALNPLAPAVGYGLSERVARERQAVLGGVNSAFAATTQPFTPQAMLQQTVFASHAHLGLQPQHALVAPDPLATAAAAALTVPASSKKTTKRKHSETEKKGQDAPAPAKKVAEQKKPSPKSAKKLVSSTSDSLRFFVPATPPSVSADEASLIRRGLYYQIFDKITDLAKVAPHLEYLYSVASSVPIPKALVLNPLKEALAETRYASIANSGVPAVFRDAAVAAILVWLWATHEKTFQEAFKKSGRLDVDRTCKHLILNALKTVLQDLAIEITDSLTQAKGVFADACGVRKSQGDAKHTSMAQSDDEKAKNAQNVEKFVSSIASKALTVRLHIDSCANASIPNLQDLVEFLDESRLGALKAKSQERVLLANLIARRTSMSESFSHAYTSAIVRAGEAMGHNQLFEIVQDELVGASTLLPYDIFVDETEEWEDPCKTPMCFTEDLTGEDMLNRSHARAMIHKSLRKLQDRNNLGGGAFDYGPYADMPEKGVTKKTMQKPKGKQRRASLKRRNSLGSDAPVHEGSGFSAAYSWHLFEPHHLSEPLQQSSTLIENKPYGLHQRTNRSRSLSLSFSSRSSEPRSAKKAKRASLPETKRADMKVSSETKVPRSTVEIDWTDVASIFQTAEVPKKSPSSKAVKPDSETVADRRIIAPFCLSFDPASLADDESDASEEDLREVTVLERHEVVLEEMKEKINNFFESQKQEQERKKQRHK